MIWTIIVLSVIAIDQLSKFLIKSNYSIGHLTPIINHFFYITHYENNGAAWSILQNARYFFLIVTVLIAAVIIYFIYHKKNPVLRTSLSLLLGGAMGNFIDRLLQGSVTDFLEFHFGFYIFPIFNLADSCLVIGVFILGFYIIFLDKPQEKQTKTK